MCIVTACEILVLNGLHEAMKLGMNLKITVQSLLERSAAVFISQETQQGRQVSALLFLFNAVDDYITQTHLKLALPFCKAMWVVTQVLIGRYLPLLI